MNRLSFFLAIISGLLMGLSATEPNAWLVWVGLVPLLVAIHGKTPGQIVAPGLAAGYTFGIVQLLWMPPVLARYAGASLFAGIAGILLMALYIAIWFALPFYLFALIRHNKSGKWLINALTFSALFFLLEWLRMQILPGMVWDKFYLACAVSPNKYMIQLAPLTGALGIGLLIAMVNYLVAAAVVRKRGLLLGIALALFVFNFLYGALRLGQGGSERDGLSHTVGLVCENVHAETRWTSSGDRIISTMLRLVDESRRHDPTLLVWSETALPWTFQENDDILLALAGIFSQGNASTQSIIGYQTQAEGDHVYNSAYLINADGSAAGRYDKNTLLSFFEEPLIRTRTSTAVPMVTIGGFDHVLRGHETTYLPTHIGNARVMICNESLLPDYARKKGEPPAFLVNISNDAWLENTQNIAQHFYIARLRAVEYNKDMVINSNRGMSGIVSRLGVVQTISQSNHPELVVGTIRPNRKTSFFARFPLFFPVLALLCVIFQIFFTFGIAKARTTPTHPLTK
ncbi:MAG: apolipoprotein N-acyltransferase [Bacteroidales bacterium]